jgi:hypothetical protein
MAQPGELARAAAGHRGHVAFFYGPGDELAVPAG